MLPRVRVVLLLTVGLPVFATQLVAWAVPRAEAVRFVPVLRQLCELKQTAQRTDTAQTPAAAVSFALAHVVPSNSGFLAAEPPADSSSRALRFLVSRYRQAT